MSKEVLFNDAYEQYLECVSVIEKSAEESLKHGYLAMFDLFLQLHLLDIAFADGEINESERDFIVKLVNNYNLLCKKIKGYRVFVKTCTYDEVQVMRKTEDFQNATKVFNETQKFPEKDAYTISKIYADWVAEGKTANTTALNVDNVLAVFDKLMEDMDEALVPAQGRLLYVTPAVKTLLKQASNVVLYKDVAAQANINRVVDRLDEVKLITVPSFLMKTAYTFTTGFAPAGSAKQINIFLVHPSAILTPSKYAFVGMEAPAAGTKGDYIYYEKEYSDVFILNNRTGAIAFNITP